MYSASDRRGSNYKFCIWRGVSSHLPHRPQEVLLAQFSLYVHECDINPSIFFCTTTVSHLWTLTDKMGNVILISLWIAGYSTFNTLNIFTNENVSNYCLVKWYMYSITILKTHIDTCITIVRLIYVIFDGLSKSTKISVNKYINYIQLCPTKRLHNYVHIGE